MAKSSGTSRRHFLTRAAAGVAASEAVVSSFGSPLFAQNVSSSENKGAIGPSQNKVSITDVLAKYATTLSYNDIPADAIAAAKRSLIDTIGCAIGAFEAEPAQIAVKLAENVKVEAGATVLCAGFKTSPELAVFANGTMMRYLDFNDGYTSTGSGHPSDIIASLLSTAEIGGRTGRDLLVATVLAYEVYCKISDVLNFQASSLDYATASGMAGVVGASRLLGLDQKQTSNAIAIHVAGNTALSQTRRGKLSNWKACSAAEANRNAVFAAQLAKLGMTGPENVFEGPEGFFSLIKLAPFKLPPLGGGDQPFGILHALTKRFSVGNYAQTVVQAAVEAHNQFPEMSEVAEINVGVSTDAIKIMADTPDKWHPQNRETADHSLPYATAIALLYGTIDDGYYDERYLHDQKVTDLVGRVHCNVSKEADQRRKEFNLCELELVFKNGDRKNIRVEYYRGHWKNPMTDAELDEKFRSLAQKRLSDGRVTELLTSLRRMDEISDIGALLALTKG